MSRQAHGRTAATDRTVPSLGIPSWYRALCRRKQQRARALSGNHNLEALGWVGRRGAAFSVDVLAIRQSNKSLRH